ncbi:hypothetical protein ACEXQB_004895 [Herbiconiux sp. P18]|uniref:hypothetical protein n=1 Tax=Herbiconiux liangxiaofengii TaxID=3342795 RepID=UPI0035B77EA0
MRVVVDRVSKGSAGVPLGETSLEYETGDITVVEGEVGDQPTVLALIASGRMVPDSGSVTIDGADDAALIRESVALVDAPDVSSPAADLRLRDVVREELMYADRSTSRATVAQTLADAGAGDYANVRMADVPAALRVRLLAELAAFRRGVRAVVLASPDRHGGDPREWFDVAADLAARDFAVLVVCGAPSALLVQPLLDERAEATAAVAPAVAAVPSAPAAPASAEAAPAHPAHARPTEATDPAADAGAAPTASSDDLNPEPLA